MMRIPAEIPPHNRDSEIIVLASILSEPTSMQKVADHIKPEDFYTKQHEIIYNAILQLYGETSKLDIALVADKLEAMCKLEAIGGILKLVEIANDSLFITSSHIIKHSKAIKKASIRRKILDYADRTRRLALDEGNEISSSLGILDSEIMKISKEYNHSFEQGEIDFTLGLEGVLEMRSPGFKGYKTGIDFLDKHTMGLKKGHLWLAYAKSAAGKTTIAIQIAREVIKAGGTVRFLSLEMSSKEIWNKLLQMEEKEGLQLGQAADKIVSYGGNLIVKDDIFDLYEIQRYIKQHATVTDVFFLDFLTLVDSSRKAGRQLGEIEGIIYNARELQKIAKMNQACIFTLSQANTDNPAVKPDAWRESIKGGNSVKQVADVMIKLTRRTEEAGSPQEKETVTIHLQKNKFGRSFLDSAYDVDNVTGGAIFK